MKVVVSGHRPQSLGRGWSDTKFHNKVRIALWDHLDVAKPDLLITGMALGVDYWAAEWCVRKGTPFIAAVPFKDQHLKWSPRVQADYNRMLKKADLVVLVDREPGYIDSRIPPDVYSSGKMQTRNRWMVDQLSPPNDRLIAVIDRTKGHSGTHACLQYAADHDKGGLVVEIAVDKIDGHFDVPDAYTSGLRDDDLPF